jgi:lipopolysaccharide export LptBFGC system permease protein LptF
MTESVWTAETVVALITGLVTVIVTICNLIGTVYLNQKVNTTRHRIEENTELTKSTSEKVDGKIKELISLTAKASKLEGLVGRRRQDQVADDDIEEHALEIVEKLTKPPNENDKT